jgi:hypothetical protein
MSMGRILQPFLLLLFAGTCLGLGCGPGKDEGPKTTSALPAASDRSGLPKRETHRN